MSSNRVKTATGEEFLRRRYCHWTWTDFKIHGESGFLTLVIDYEGTVRLEVELADLFAWVRRRPPNPFRVEYDFNLETPGLSLRSNRWAEISERLRRGRAWNF